jgi:soluble lytic murein transglycosylase-like protein
MPTAPGTYQALAAEAAVELGIPVEIGAALVAVESGFDPDAWNPEPRYNYLWDVRKNAPFRRLKPEELASKLPPQDFPAPPGVDPDAEYWGQQASWGLGQLMGANARALGFKGKYLTGLASRPDVALRLAFLHLSRIRDHFLKNTGWEGVMAAYNAGSPRRAPDGKWENQRYVDKIAAALGGAWPK